jgi:hypothetical protein
MQCDSELPWPVGRKFASPQALSVALLELSPAELESTVGHAAAIRFRRRHETICDLIVAAIRVGTSPVRLFDSLDIS